MLSFKSGTKREANLPLHEATCTHEQVSSDHSSKGTSSDSRTSLPHYENIFQTIKRRKPVGQVVELIRIRVYYGGRCRTHEESWITACKRFEANNPTIKLAVEDLTVDMIKDLKGPFTHWTHPRYLVDWLLDSDFHCILCQGLFMGLFGMWNIEETNLEARRLVGHRGFPSERLDPVMEGDKYAYLELIPEFVNPTLKIPLHYFVGKTRATFVETLSYTAMIARAKEFMATYTDGNDWYLKAPYVQHKEGYKSKWVRSIESLDFWLKATMTKSSTSFFKLGTRPCEVFPYLMLQPRMKSNNESKIILHNGEAKYLSITDKTTGLVGQTLRDAVPLAELMTLSEMVIKTLKFRCPYFECGGLTRVDIFMNAAGKLIINEVESFDANYSSSKPDNQSETKNFLSKYFESLLFEALILNIHSS